MFGLSFLASFSGEGGNKPARAGVPASSPGSGGAATASPAPDPFAEQRRQDRRDIERFLGGDNAGFEELMMRHRARAYGIALSLTGNHDDAMDAMQKAFIRIHRSLGRFRLEEPFFPWLYRIVRNAALNQRRDEKRHKGDCPLEWVTRPDDTPDPLSATEADELRERLWAGIRDLPEEMRLVFNLYSFEGLKYREIAALLDIPLGTVMSRLHAARTRLRAAIDREDAP